jgi:hypothetical protein
VEVELINITIHNPVEKWWKNVLINTHWNVDRKAGVFIHNQALSAKTVFQQYNTMCK